MSAWWPAPESLESLGALIADALSPLWKKLLTPTAPPRILVYSPDFGAHALALRRVFPDATVVAAFDDADDASHLGRCAAASGIATTLWPHDEAAPLPPEIPGTLDLVVFANHAIPGLESPPHLNTAAKRLAPGGALVCLEFDLAQSMPPAAWLKEPLVAESRRALKGKATASELAKLITAWVTATGRPAEKAELLSVNLLRSPAELRRAYAGLVLRLFERMAPSLVAEGKLDLPGGDELSRLVAAVDGSTPFGLQVIVAVAARAAAETAKSPVRGALPPPDFVAVEPGEGEWTLPLPREGELVQVPLAMIRTALKDASFRGLLRVTSWGVPGWIRFRDGEPVDAALGTKTGDAAMRNLLLYTEGTFEVIPEAVPAAPAAPSTAPEAASPSTAPAAASPPTALESKDAKATARAAVFEAAQRFAGSMEAVKVIEDSSPPARPVVEAPFREPVVVAAALPDDATPDRAAPRVPPEAIDEPFPEPDGDASDGPLAPTGPSGAMFVAPAVVEGADEPPPVATASAEAPASTPADAAPSAAGEGSFVSLLEEAFAAPNSEMPGEAAADVAPAPADPIELPRRTPVLMPPLAAPSEPAPPVAPAVAELPASTLPGPVAAPQAVSPAEPAWDAAEKSTAAAAPARPASPPDALPRSGFLQDHSVPNLVAAARERAASGTVEIESFDNRGTIVFESGSPTGWTFGNLAADAARARLEKLAEGEFHAVWGATAVAVPAPATDAAPAAPSPVKPAAAAAPLAEPPPARAQAPLPPPAPASEPEPVRKADAAASAMPPDEGTLEEIAGDILLSRLEASAFTGELGIRQPGLTATLKFSSGRVVEAQLVSRLLENVVEEVRTMPEGFYTLAAAEKPAAPAVERRGPQVPSRGDLSQMAIVDLMHIARVSRETGVLEIRSPKDTGAIHFRAGVEFHAELGSARGVSAIARLLKLKAGAFTFDPKGQLARAETLPPGYEENLWS